VWRVACGVWRVVRSGLNMVKAVHVLLCQHASEKHPAFFFRVKVFNMFKYFFLQI